MLNGLYNASQMQLFIMCIGDLYIIKQFNIYL